MIVVWTRIVSSKTVSGGSKKQVFGFVHESFKKPSDPPCPLDDCDIRVLQYSTEASEERNQTDVVKFVRDCDFPNHKVTGGLHKRNGMRRFILKG